MPFTTYLPSTHLQPYISHFAISEAAAAGTYKVLPGTGLVIGFQYRGSLACLQGQNAIPLSASGITGLHDSYRLFQNSPGIGTVLVYFREAGATAFFRPPVHELFRQSLALDVLMPRSELTLVEEQLYAAGTDAARIAVVEQFLLARMQPAPPDRLVAAALTLIRQSNGVVRIKTLADALHTSQSPLEKRFRKTVGASPKKFASIVRFQHILRCYRPGTGLTGLGYDAGFYDQAHFIKDFKTFTGHSPEAYFRSK